MRDSLYSNSNGDLSSFIHTCTHQGMRQKRPLRKDVSAHSNDLPSKLLAHTTKQTLYSSAAREASHKQRLCGTRGFTSVPSRWCQCKESCWGPFTRFYLNLQLLNSVSPSVSVFFLSHITVSRRFWWGCQNYPDQMSSFTLQHMPEASLTATREALKG